MIRQISAEMVYSEYDSDDELDDKQRQLLVEARKALSGSYAPYSNYHVGAALELENGQIVSGSNQENASYPSGLCAERVAFFTAGAQYPDQKIMRVAITAKTEKFPISQPIAPCGSCRQVMLETELKFDQNIEVILQGMEGVIWVVPSIKVLLPLHFSEDKLKK
jgi:cytidine deaminase